LIFTSIAFIGKIFSKEKRKKKKAYTEVGAQKKPKGNGIKESLVWWLCVYAVVFWFFWVFARLLFLLPFLSFSFEVYGLLRFRPYASVRQTFAAERRHPRHGSSGGSAGRLRPLKGAKRRHDHNVAAAL
jgi:hypothetical protein